jgi:hypothetical protein
MLFLGDGRFFIRGIHIYICNGVPNHCLKKFTIKMIQNLIDFGAANTQKFKRRSAANI